MRKAACHTGSSIHFVTLPVQDELRISYQVHLKGQFCFIINRGTLHLALRLTLRIYIYVQCVQYIFFQSIHMHKLEDLYGKRLLRRKLNCVPFVANLCVTGDGVLSACVWHSSPPGHGAL